MRHSLTELPVFLPVTEWSVPDPQQSPGIDLGDGQDSASLEPSPNGGFINLGAFGGTEQASKSPLEYVLVTVPNGGQSWPAEREVVIRWRSETLGGPNTVDIELHRESDSGFVYTIASNALNSGSFPWIVPVDVAIPPASDYRLAVTRSDDPSLTDVSDDAFTITGPISNYYVNDGSVNVAGDWTTAPGNDAQNGLTPNTPKATIQGVLNAYDLGPGDTILVDAGNYALTTNIEVTANDAGVAIVGYHDATYPTRIAHLDRGNTADGSYVFELNNADAITIDSLSISGGYHGVDFGDLGDNDNVVISNNRIYDNAKSGINLSGTAGIINDHVTISHNRVFGNQEFGVHVGNYNDNIQVTGNEVFGNRDGIRAGDYLGGSALVSDNIVHDNTRDGILANYDTIVQGNTVFGHNGANDAGVSISSGAMATENTVYENFNGINVDGSTSGNVGEVIASGNRVYDNRNIGIWARDTKTVVRGNTVYSNAIGIQGSRQSYQFDGLIENNLVYANTSQGIVLDDATMWIGPSPRVYSNTIYQPTGDAIVVQNTSQDVGLKNNIVWVDSGAAITVSADSQTNFSSDYNLFHLTGTAVLANWAGTPFDSLADWFYELGQDGHSQRTDPLLVDIDGPDDLLGYSRTPIGPAIILDDEDPGVTLHGSWTENETGGYQGDYWRADSVSSTGTWEFTGLVPGTYEIATTWNYGNYSLDARYQVNDGTRILTC